MGANAHRTSGGQPIDLPVLDSCWRAPGGPDGTVLELGATRSGPNLWEVVVGAPGSPGDPHVNIELDVCGAWLTLATSTQRPVVVRRAGWVDLRGHPPAPPERRWDRVGLGPGDAIVATVGGQVEDGAMLRALLDCGSAEAAVLADAARRAAGPGTGILALRVPPFTPEESVARVAAATGLPPERFDQPLHPVGSPDAELWRARPAPPREARLRVDPTVEAVPRARELLRRLMASWRMPEVLDGPLELLATELVTNAVIHARTLMDVVITYDGTAVRFEVEDRERSLPTLVEPDPEAEGGRGLWLVDQLATRWAVEPAAGGKRVWFAVAA